jgi:hypothetical protein
MTLIPRDAINRKNRRHVYLRAFERERSMLRKLRNKLIAAHPQVIEFKENALAIFHISIILDIWILNRPSLP